MPALRKYLAPFLRNILAIAIMMGWGGCALLGFIFAFGNPMEGQNPKFPGGRGWISSFAEEKLAIERNLHGDRQSINFLCNDVWQADVSETGRSLLGCTSTGFLAASTGGSAFKPFDFHDPSTAITLADNGTPDSPALSGQTIADDIVFLTCQDADGCTVTFNFVVPGAFVGQEMNVVNLGTNLVFITDNVTNNLNRGAILNQFDTIKLLYTGYNWTEVSRADISDPGVVTMPDDGTGAKQTATLEPTTDLYALKCEDTQGCDLTINQTENDDRDRLTLTGHAAETSPTTVLDNDTTIDLAGDANLDISFPDTLTLINVSNAWIEVSRSDN